MTEKETYRAARIAIRETKDPKAFLRLGTLFAKGIGTRENHVLANYYYDKALDLGCEEADDFINQEYDNGTKDLFRDIEKAFENPDSISPQTFDRFKRVVERQREKKNYGILSRTRQYLHHFYPSYTQDKAIADILNDRETIDADLLYATSTADNTSEFNIDMLDSLLQQLFSPVFQDEELLQKIMESEGASFLEHDEQELVQCIANLKASYNAICNKFSIAPKELMPAENLVLSPYIKASTLALLRRQAFKCLLSIKDVDTMINDKYLNNLGNDEELLNICGQIRNQDIQLFLISFVELNIDAETLEMKHQGLLSSYKRYEQGTLARHLNEFSERLATIGIDHQLPEFTPENLPPIDLS